MSYFAQHARSRWAVPVAAVVALGATSFVVSHGASADTGLPSRTAEQLLTDVQHADLRSLSGTVVQTADLGLPQVPGLANGGGSGLSLTSLASGSHTWRVWFSGPTQQRLALVSSLGESDIIRNGADVWLWSSQDKTAVHHTLTSATQHSPSPLPSHSIPVPGVGATPAEAAQQALAMLGASTKVTTSGTAVVAGRSAYELVLAPKDNSSRVAQIRIAIDADEHIPLRVQVYSTKMSNPAFEVGFTSIDFTKPDVRQFTFNPPPGTTVTQAGSLLGTKTKTKTKTNAAPSTMPSTQPSAAGPMPGSKLPASTPTIVGSGWGTIVVTSLPELAAGSSGAANSRSASQLGGILGTLPTASGTWGSGHVIDGTLLSAVITDNGRVAVGAVAPEALYAALAAK